jgi:Haloacid dehalogenase-like hydrolase
LESQRQRTYWIISTALQVNNKKTQWNRFDKLSVKPWLSKNRSLDCPRSWRTLALAASRRGYARETSSMPWYSNLACILLLTVNESACQSSSHKVYSWREHPSYHASRLHVQDRFSLLIRTREFKPPKPSPAGIIHIASQWSLPSANNLIMVGDSIDDMTAGRLAGSATVLLINEANKDLALHPNTDLVISSLHDLIQILEDGFTGREIPH